MSGQVMPPQDWTCLPLTEGGRSLVEASAGTGKTWTIAALYLRLLLERQLSPRQIVVSTFTNAAAAELGDRLRAKLRWAIAEAWSYREDAPDDAAERSDRLWLRARWRRDQQAIATDVKRLQAALTELDGAPIGTLHRLCSRILAEHPVAAGAAFRNRELVDGKALQAALAKDLWRVISQGEDTDELVALARATDITLKKLDRYIPILLHPDAVVEPVDPATITTIIAGVVGDVRAWIANVRAVQASDGLVDHRRRLPKAWYALADALEAEDGDVLGVLKEYRKDLLQASLREGINKAGQTDPLVLGLVQRSAGIVESIDLVTQDRASHVPLRRFLAAAQRWCRKTLQARLEAANQLSFDQLLVAVRAALAPRDGQRALADALFAVWPVALVDEFQDTDPVQFGILDAIYRDADGAPRGRLVMIGDPKQAIYRFRGGDVQAYERAKADVPIADRLSLGVNHRSSRAYVEAVNQFYEATGLTLGPETSDTPIRYARVEASSRRDDAPLCCGPDAKPVTRPLVLHRIDPEIAPSDLEAHALRACAKQIVQALSEQGYRIGSRRLQPGDIAVLLPTNGQVERLAAILKAHGVPCVISAQKSVFQTETARELRLILHAVLNAHDPRCLRAALATRLLGGSLASLQALSRDTAAWDRHSGDFHRLHAMLERGGPLALVAGLLERHAQRLLETVQGERILTDLRHLGELLQEAWQRDGSGERLLAWFADQMESDGEDSDAVDARALRLESDAQRVQVMTLHASKGLEFGVVFLPLMWKHRRSRASEQAPQLLSSADGRVNYLVEDEARELVRQQEYEERFRVLYVALTRAIHACHVFVLPEPCKPSPLLMAKAKSPRAAVAEMQKNDGLTPVIRKARSREVALNALSLEALARGRPARYIEIRQGWDVPNPSAWREETPDVSLRAARPLPAPLSGPLPMLHSFTTLNGGAGHSTGAEASAAEDEVQAAPADIEQSVPVSDLAADAGVDAATHPELDALSAIAGIEFGNAVHALFEHRAPGCPITPENVLATLQEHGIQLDHGAMQTLSVDLARRLQAVLQTPLADVGGPRLWDLTAGDMRAELEFHYLLDGVSLSALRKACAEHGEAELVPAREQMLAGLMTGKIDLVFAHGGRFHVLDYKGNRLGGGLRASLQDYAPPALEIAMRTSGYRLQALLYTVALERYLRARLGDAYRRDRHLGDCWYLFIRAVGLRLPDGTPCGVWRHRFDDGLLDAVQHVLGLEWKAVA